MNEQTFDYEAWRERFERLLSLDPRAARSMNCLLEFGLDKDGFALLLSFTCDFDASPGYEAFQMLLGTAAEEAKEAEALSRRLQKDRKAILEFRKSDAPKELLNALEAFESYLQSEAEEMRKIASLRSRVPSMFMTWLITNVKAETGAPHYREVCDLLEIAYCAHRQSPPEVGPDAIRKTFKRYMQSDPDPWFLDKQELTLVWIVLVLVALWQAFKSGEDMPSVGEIGGHNGFAF